MRAYEPVNNCRLRYLTSVLQLTKPLSIDKVITGVSLAAASSGAVAGGGGGGAVINSEEFTKSQAQ